MCCAACRLLVLNFREQDRELMSSKDEAQTKFWEQVGGAESRFKTGVIQRSIQNKHVIKVKDHSVHARTLKHKIKGPNVE